MNDDVLQHKKTSGYHARGLLLAEGGRRRKEDEIEEEVSIS
jgi:hypothetical protein